MKADTMDDLTAAIQAAVGRCMEKYISEAELEIKKKYFQDTDVDVGDTLRQVWRHMDNGATAPTKATTKAAKTKATTKATKATKAKATSKRGKRGPSAWNLYYAYKKEELAGDFEGTAATMRAKISEVWKGDSALQEEWKGKAKLERERLKASVVHEATEEVSSEVEPTGEVSSDEVEPREVWDCADCGTSNSTEREHCVGCEINYRDEDGEVDARHTHRVGIDSSKELYRKPDVRVQEFSVSKHIVKRILNGGKESWECDCKSKSKRARLVKEAKGMLNGSTSNVDI